MKNIFTSALFAIVATAFWMTPGLTLGTTFIVQKSEAQASVPDFTSGDKPDSNIHDWNLGPTGARGWIFGKGRETTLSRQIYITKLAPGSPAAQVLRTGDVILGIGEKKFESDARIAYGKAIGEAEAAGGRLNLLVWRSGKEKTLTVRIQKLGAYSDTAPYNCRKSKKIFEQGCEAIVNPSGERLVKNPITRSCNAMVLLASGNKKYLPFIQKEIKWASKYKIPDSAGFQSWFYGYVNMFLCEYVMATGDKSVLPSIRRLAVDSARGQSSAGTWGHRFANPETKVCLGYGAMNSPGLTMTMSLQMATEVGVRDPEVKQAIEKAHRYFKFYTGKGTLPYGDHQPGVIVHDDNGKSSMAAVMFDLLGDKEGTEFFAKMATASNGLSKDIGHTGNFFAFTWALPGVSRGGPNATGAWFKNGGWRYDLARRWDGSFLYQGEPGVPKNKDHKYANWDSTGAYLLNYAVGAKSLRIGGSKPSVSKELTPEEAAEVTADGADWGPATKDSAYAERSTQHLLEGLSSWSPVVRERSAKHLKKRGNKEVLTYVMRLLKRGELHEKLGACRALEAMGRSSVPAIPLLAKTLKDDELWLRVQAGRALAATGPKALATAPELLKVVADVDESDPRQTTQRYVSYLLFGSRPVYAGAFNGMLSKSLEGVDPDLVYEAVQVVLKNPESTARGSLESVYKTLSFEEIAPLLPAIRESVLKPATSGVMFSGPARTTGIKLFAKHRIAEGMEMCIEVMEPTLWGKGSRIKGCLKVLESYGGHAKSQIKALEEMEQYLLGENPNSGSAKDIRESINRIKQASNGAPLRKMPQSGKKKKRRRAAG